MFHGHHEALCNFPFAEPCPCQPQALRDPKSPPAPERLAPARIEIESDRLRYLGLQD